VAAGPGIRGQPPEGRVEVIKTVDDYLRQMRKELAGCDRSTIQDALADAEEYLRNALENVRETSPNMAESEAMMKIIEQYGTPEEVAAAYKEIENRVTPAFTPSRNKESHNLAARFFGVMSDPRSWGALFYLLFSLATGIFYFTWAVTGISLSLGLLVLVVGIPFAGIFILSVRGLALLEGRLVEALLGVRMPRRPIFTNKNRSLWGRFTDLISDKYTWFTLVYMILQLPLGVVYFSVFISLIATSLWLIARPILELGLGQPIFTAGAPYYTPVWLMPFAVIGGVLLIVLTMHLTRIIGKAHGRFAKIMLVRE
jgi:uncharacterized membrane protein